MALSTVSGILTRIGMGKLGRLGLEPAAALSTRPTRRAAAHRRQEARTDSGRRRPAMARETAAASTRSCHRCGRTPTADVGWEYVHVASTTRPAWPTSRCSTTRKRPPPSDSCAARSSTTRLGITIERVITDNGSAYRLDRHAIACRTLRIRHIRTRPYRPQTNGKAERFIRTLLGGWAYGAIYRSSPNAPLPSRAGSTGTNPTTTRRPQPQATHRSPRRAEQPPRVLHLGNADH